MNTKRQIKSQRFSELVLNEGINPIPIKENYPKLEGSGIQFFKFVFKPNTTILVRPITPQLLKQFPLKDQNKYNYNLLNKKAFTYRVYNGEVTSPVLHPDFVKYIEDLGYPSSYNIFGYINDWVKKLNKEWKFEK